MYAAGDQHVVHWIEPRLHPSASVSIRQHPSAYVSMYAAGDEHVVHWVELRLHPSASVGIRQHPSAYASIRQLDAQRT
jgi:hypothetical protein